MRRQLRPVNEPISGAIFAQLMLFPFFREGMVAGDPSPFRALFFRPSDRCRVWPLAKRKIQLELDA
jgi:hypothetical protein